MATYREQRKRTTSSNDHTGHSRMRAGDYQLLSSVYAGMGSSGVRPRHNVHPRSDHGDARRCYRKGREHTRNDGLDLRTVAIVLLAILMIELSLVIGILSKKAPEVEQVPSMAVSDKLCGDEFTFDGQRYVIIRGEYA